LNLLRILKFFSGRLSAFSPGHAYVPYAPMPHNARKARTKCTGGGFGGPG